MKSDILLSVFALISAAVVAADTLPGCSNPRIENGRFVADCVDHRNSEEFYFVDVNDEYKAMYENALGSGEPGPFAAGKPSDSAGSPDGRQKIADQVFAAWVSDPEGPDSHNATDGRRRHHDRRLQLPRADDIVREVYDNIQIADLSAAEEGRVGAVVVQAGSATSLCSRRTCDPRHIITLLDTAGKWVSYAYTVKLIVGEIINHINKSDDKKKVRSACMTPDGMGKTCVSFGRWDAMYLNEEAVDKAVRDCLSQCVFEKKSCQRSWTSLTQQHNCRPWYCPWCSDKCDHIEKHENNICISDRPKGCTINRDLNCEPPAPK